MNIDEICANSFRNFHAKGLDYLCLSRTPELTDKVYFFGGDLTAVPEIVMPHNHRYTFATKCLAGEFIDRKFKRVFKGENLKGRPAGRFDEFDYLTPLNGGDGFTWKREALLAEIDNRRVRPGLAINNHHTNIHTLQILKEGTVIRLRQQADALPLDQPTSSFRPVGSREPPNLSGLYDPMTPDHALTLIDRLKKLGVQL